MKMTKRCVLIFGVLVLCVGCDQTTKFVAESYLPVFGVSSFLGDTVRLQLAHNPGAFLGLGATLPDVWRNGIFLMGAGVMLLSLLGYSLFSKSITQFEIIAIALLFSGGVSNLADRLLYGGYVIDFMNLGIGSLRTGIFNVADIAVTLGAVILVSGMSRQRKKNV
jgi:signal peptidase II